MRWRQVARGALGFAVVVALFALPYAPHDRDPADAAVVGPDLRATVAERPVDGTIQAADGKVLSMAQAGNTVVFGGEFTQVGPGRLGAAGVVDLDAAHFGSTFPDVNGAVYTALPDGAGGWFLGGDFTTVGGAARRNVARVDAAGTVRALTASTHHPVLNEEAAALRMLGRGAFRNCAKAAGALCELLGIPEPEKM